jgi:hypothetical protein
MKMRTTLGGRSSADAPRANAIQATKKAVLKRRLGEFIV